MGKIDLRFFIKSILWEYTEYGYRVWSQKVLAKTVLACDPSIADSIIQLFVNDDIFM